ncbi:unnamed protein product, partial [Sphacelaria rigidula]
AFFPRGTELHDQLFFRVGDGPGDILPFNERVLEIFPRVRMRRRIDFAGGPGGGGGGGSGGEGASAEHRSSSISTDSALIGSGADERISMAGSRIGGDHHRHTDSRPGTADPPAWTGTGPGPEAAAGATAVGSTGPYVKSDSLSPPFAAGQQDRSSSLPPLLPSHLAQTPAHLRTRSDGAYINGVTGDTTARGSGGSRRQGRSGGAVRRKFGGSAVGALVLT